MYRIEMNKFKPLISHQSGIKIKNIVLEQMKNDDIVVLDFVEVDVCTDSFIQQLTVILANEIGFDTFREKIKFLNLNDFLKEMVKSKLFLASKVVA